MCLLPPITEEEEAHFVNTHVQNVCVRPPSYCVPILSKRQKAHLDLVGWKVGLLHRALLVNRGLIPVSRATRLRPPLSAWISTCPPSKCPAQQIFETLQVNHKTEPPPPPSPASSFTNREREGVTKAREKDTHTHAAGTSGRVQNRQSGYR